MEDSLPPVQRAAAGIIRLEGEAGLGTAFVISRSGLALTNHHVVVGQNQLLARFDNDRVVPVRVLRSDEEADVALIEVQCDPDCLTLSLGSANDVTLGSDIFALGHPAGLTATVTRGIVGGLRRAGGVTLVQVDAALNTGNSGGPIIDAETGDVIAIVSFKLREKGRAGVWRCGR